MKVTLLLIAVLAVCAGCKKETASAPRGQTPPQESAEQGHTNQTELAIQQDKAIPQPSRDGLVALCSDSNPYIKNNARQALECWDAKDYNGAVLGLQKVISLCRSASQQNSALSSLAQLKQDIDRAAAKGDSNAREAQAQLAQSN